MSHFFISRAGEDRQWAKWISNTLEDADHLLLARGRPADPDEASRCGMGLYLRDPRLANYKKATA